MLFFERRESVLGLCRFITSEGLLVLMSEEKRLKTRKGSMVNLNFIAVYDSLKCEFYNCYSGIVGIGVKAIVSSSNFGSFGGSSCFFVLQKRSEMMMDEIQRIIKSTPNVE